MEHQVVLEEACVTSNTPVVSRQQMPLSFLHANEIARVVYVRCKGSLHHHLKNLGFVEGTKVRVISEHAGNLIVEVKGTTVAIDKSVALKVMVN